MTITEFLEARIAEDEAVAHAAASQVSPNMDAREPAGEQWHDDGDGMVVGADGFDLWDCEGSFTLCTSRAAAEHMARHDPGRVLAECAAKRAIVADHPDGAAAYKNPDGSYMRLFHGYCETCEIGHEAAPWPCTTLRALAAVYADHPDYEPGWAL